MSVWEDLDLTRHAIIEASAGTGKTYALERIVVRLLSERSDLTIDQLLIVTFTEKATGELKDRIRGILERRVREELQKSGKDACLITRLQSALDAFDSAAISTIHGFCQRILQEYAFENRQVMDLQLENNAEFSMASVHQLLRANPSLYVGTRQDLREEASGIPTDINRPKNINRWIGDITGILDTFRGPPWDRLGEQVDGDDIETALADGLVPAKAAIRACLQVPLQAGCLTSRYGMLNFHAGSRKAMLKLVEPLETWLLSNDAGPAGAPTPAALLPSPGTIAIRSFITFAQQAQDSGRLKALSFGCLIPEAWSKSGDNAASVFPELHALVAALDKYLVPAMMLLPAYQHRRDVRLLTDAQSRIDDIKARKGLITFDDMIRRVWKALDGDGPSSVLIDAIRRRYRVALVDEFQDTDPLQWDIFRRLFVDSAPDHRLIIVGDPKQAIYAFRGADVRTYLAAKDTLLSRGAIPHELRETYRCVPELVDAFNTLFAGSHWFPHTAEGQAIAYTGVDNPAVNLKIKVGKDETGCRSLTLVNLGEDAPNGTIARRRMADFITAEIKRLLDHPEQFRFQAPGAPAGTMKDLDGGDICILVEKRKTAKRIEQRLRECNIPFSIYRQPGLYQSDEAFHLRAMLDFLARPNDEQALRTALLSRFMAVPLERIETHEGASDQTLLRLRDALLTLCERRRWGQLFEALVLDTGLWWREAAEADGDRRMANFRQLFDDLLEAAGRDISDIAGMAALHRQRMAESSSDVTGSDVHRKESEASKVQIMTMHVAKGLEFPLVFIADGFSDPQDTLSKFGYLKLSDPRTPDDGAGKDAIRCFSFDTRDPRKKQAAAADAGEGLKRLYYVALTRAQYKLYLPWLPDGQQSKRASASPLNKLLIPGAALLLKAHPGIVTCMAYDSPGTNGMADGSPTALEAASAARAKGTPCTIPAASLFTLPPVAGRRMFVDSFSSLSAHGSVARGTHAAAVASISVQDAPPEMAGDEVSSPMGEAPGESEPQATPAGRFVSLLPKGALSGEAFHEIMESLCHPTPGQPGFETFRRFTGIEELLAHPALAGLLDRTLAKHRILNRQRFHPETGALLWDTRRELAVMAWRALRTPLQPSGIALQEVEAGDRKAEVEFFLSEQRAILGEKTPVRRTGLMTGFIDLVFRHAGKYYILDWKTNTLDDYSADGVMEAMDASDYHLQYRIYTLAVREWLRQSLPAGASVDDAFGGAFYLFVRGGGESPDGVTGLFGESWSRERLAGYQQSVCERLHPRHTGDDGTEDA
jgi:exodeoxyribonuclease V beta subunit